MPAAIQECLAVLAARDGDARLVAGGTDLVPQMKNGLVKPGWLVDLSGIAELKTIERLPSGGLGIGAGVSARALELAPEVRESYPALAESAGLVGSVQVRNLATL